MFFSIVRLFGIRRGKYYDAGLSGNNIVLQRSKPIAIQDCAGDGEAGKSYTFTIGIIEATFGTGIFFFCHSHKKWQTKIGIPSQARRSTLL
jgi:glycerol kinase